MAASSTMGSLREYYATGATKPLAWRVRALRQLKRLVEDNSAAWTAALADDLGKSAVESEITEFNTVTKEIDFALENLASWMTPESVPSTGVSMPSFSWIRREPRGLVLIISPFNYPVALALGPLVGALAGGNCVVIKPSELCPAVSATLARLMPLYFGNEVLVVEGGIPESTELLKEAWGLVFFTGSERVGKVVARACAETLTPTVLELGGKCPVVLDGEHTPDLLVACRRIVWGKLLNCGQTCIAPDFVCIPEAKIAQVATTLKSVVEEMFGADPKKSPDLSRICQRAHAERLHSMLLEAEEHVEVVCGGAAACDVDSRYIAPTILRVLKHTDMRILREEIFGPILLLVPSEDAIATVRKIQAGRTPLCLYVFSSSSASMERLLEAIPSGGAVRNDCVIHFANPNLPFGGSGTSGYGSAHGRFSFDAFTHARAVLYKPAAVEFAGIRYAPYDKYGGGSGRTFALLSRILPDTPVIRRRALALLAVALPVGLLLATANPASSDGPIAALRRIASPLHSIIGRALKSSSPTAK